MIDFDRFLQWETTTRDTIDFKKAYVDMAADLIAGLLLSQIIYWHLPDKEGQPKLRVYKSGYWWIAKQRDDWWNEIRITPKQFDRACKILIDKGLIVKNNFRFNGLKTMHVRIVKEQFMGLWQAVLDNPPDNPYKQRRKPVFTFGENRNVPQGKTGIDQREIPLTEITTETTRDDDNDGRLAAHALIYLGIDADIAKAEATKHDPELILAWCAAIAPKLLRGGARPGLILSKLRTNEPVMPHISPESLAGFRQTVADYMGRR